MPNKKPYTRKPLVQSPERDRLVLILKDIYKAQHELWKICVSDRDHSKGLFHVALYLEDDPRFYRWFRDLVECAQIPWELVERTEREIDAAEQQQPCP
jgi:hypothetical protein